MTCCALAAAKKELHRVLVEDELKGAALLVFANKQDMDGARSPEEIAKHLNLAEWVDFGRS